MTVHELAARLGVTVKSRKANGGLMALCPLHDDRAASLSLDVGTDGDKPLLRCFAGCDTAPLLERLSHTQPAPPKKRIVATYDYHDAAGDLLFQVCRFEPKGFAQRRPDGRGSWIWGLGDVEPVLFGLPMLRARADGLVFVVEGEKDADTLGALDLLATTSPMGAGKWRPAYSEALRDRQVVILPDNDGPGRQHARQVAEALQGVAALVKVVELAGLPDKGDVSDWLAAGHTAADLEQLVADGPEWRPASIIEFPGNAPEQPEFRRAGLGYVFEPRGYAVRLRCDYLRQRSDDLAGEIDAEQFLPGYEQGRIARGRLNFGAPKSVQAHAQLLAAQSDSSIPWLALLRAFIDQVVDAERDGEPFVKIGRRAAIEQDTWLIDRVWRAGKMMWWYGPRASVKSQLAALMAVCLSEGLPFLERPVQQTRVGLLDYEDDDIEWERVIQEIARGLDIETPDIFYRSCRVPLKQQQNTIARMATSEGLGALIVDSFGLAGGSTSEHSSFDETALAFGMMQKELGLSMAVIDHVTHAARRNTTEAAEPFGSQYKLALARTGFEVRKVQDEGANVAHIGIFDRKHRRFPAIGVGVTWHDDGRITFAQESLQEQDVELAASVPLVERIAHALQHGERSVQEIAESLEKDEPSVRTTLNRHKGRRFTQRDQSGKWGLLHLALLPQVETRNA
ncbi:MAG: AAA family ATPase [Chloroflexota bacterium]